MRSLDNGLDSKIEFNDERDDENWFGSEEKALKWLEEQHDKDRNFGDEYLFELKVVYFA